MSPDKQAAIGTMRVTLRYDGPDVEDGSIAIEDMVAAIKGFADSYNKLAKRYDVKAEHELRVTSLEKHSSDIGIRVLEWLAANQVALKSFGLIAGSAFTIVKTIEGVIRIKKHIQEKDHTVEPKSIAKAESSPTVIVKNYNKISLEVPLDWYDVFKDRLIDDDLAKLAKPLSAGKVDLFELKSQDAGGR